jgi:hypothetical protein
MPLCIPTSTPISIELLSQGEDGGVEVLQNYGILLHHYTASQPTKAELESSSL